MGSHSQILPSPPLTVDIKPKVSSQDSSPVNGSGSIGNVSSALSTPAFDPDIDTGSDGLVLAPLKLPPPILDPPKFPPPPSRQCRIIQTPSEPKGRAAKGRKRSAQSPLETENRQKARKTAHSDIERRRRIKINEQFEELKDLVPACNNASAKGENGLHKLVILQETVAFIKYLKQCMQTVQSPGVMAKVGSNSSSPSLTIAGRDASSKLKIANLLT
jgi:Helix-loop-helix DNA-binding domain